MASRSKVSPTETGQTNSRRNFFALIGWGGLGAFFVGLVQSTIRFFYPNVLYEPPTFFKAGRPEDFPLKKMVFFPEERTFLILEPEGFHAISAICTHLGCSVSWEEEEGIFFCPCHGARYHRDGHNYAGPAPRPLDSYQVTLAKDGTLLVEKSKIIERSQGRLGAFERYFKI